MTQKETEQEDCGQGGSPQEAEHEGNSRGGTPLKTEQEGEGGNPKDA